MALARRAAPNFDPLGRETQKKVLGVEPRSVYYYGYLVTGAERAQDAMNRPIEFLMDRFGTSMKRSRRLAVLAVIFAALPLTGVSRPAQQRERALCCLCMCHSVDENQCAQVCIHMQHGKKIIEEPEMNACTKSCERHGVRQIFFSEDGTQLVITPALTK
jgi:hypothetical protein